MVRIIVVVDIGLEREKLTYMVISSFSIVAHKNRNDFDRAKLVCQRTNPAAWGSN